MSERCPPAAIAAHWNCAFCADPRHCCCQSRSEITPHVSKSCSYMSCSRCNSLIFVQTPFCWMHAYAGLQYFLLPITKDVFQDALICLQDVQEGQEVIGLAMPAIPKNLSTANTRAFSMTVGRGALLEEQCTCGCRKLPKILSDVECKALQHSSKLRINIVPAKQF